MTRILEELPLAAVLLVYLLLMAGVARKMLISRRDAKQAALEQRLLDYLEFNRPKKGGQEE